MNGEIPGLYKVKTDYGFAVAVWAMFLGPPIAAFAFGNWWLLLFWIIPLFAFGMA